MSRYVDTSYSGETETFPGTTSDSAGESESEAARSPNDEASESGSEHPVYKWTCPICDASKLLLTSREGSVIQALRAHLRTIEDDDHGPGYTYPPNVDEDSLSECIDRMGG